MFLANSILLATFAVAQILCSHQLPSVIVIGAGPSGVAAATRLLAHGLTNLTILEAEPRIGGRINSVYFGDAYVDLGAHWCHGEGDNIVYSLVKDLDLLRHTEREAIIYHSRENISSDFEAKLKALLWGVYGSNTTGVNDSVREFYLRRYNEVVATNLTDSTESRVAQDASRLLLQFILAHRGSLSLDDVILNRDYRICSGDLRLNWNGRGYRTILDVLIRRIPDPSQELPFDERLQLNKEVVNINWESTPLVVTCVDGSSYSADHVIFTPSVGVLKHDHESLFTPALPEAKRSAIQDIGLGGIVDYSLYFPERWWPTGDEFSGYYFVWDRRDVDEAVRDYQNLTQNNSSAQWILDLFNVEPTERNPNVLTLWVTGNTAPHVEQISDEELVNGTLFVLNRFLGRLHNITRPTQIIRSRWYSNPHFRGVYSYQTHRAHDRQPSAEVELSLPLTNSTGHPVLQFAGEATHPHYYSTVHGAIETGFREADRIIHLHHSN